MAISLSDLKQVRADKPPRLLVYGPPGIGKTTLASEFPNAVFLQIEDGTPGDTELTSFGELSNYGDVMDALAAIYQEDHEYRTLVIDSVTKLEKLVFAEACRRGDEHGNAKANIEDFGYGKGYVYAFRVMEEIVEAINAIRNDRKIGVILIAHSNVQRFDDPETVSYDRYEIALRTSDKPNADIRGMVEREMDGILLLKQPVNIKGEDRKGAAAKTDKAIARVRADGGGAILIHAIGKPAYTAKNRYGIPNTVRYDKGKGFAALAPYLPGYEAPTTVAADKKEAA